MTTYTLVVRPDGRAILTSPRPLSPDEQSTLADGFARWEATERGTLILPDCDVVQVLTLDLDDARVVTVPDLGDSELREGR